MERGAKTGSFSYMLWPSHISAYTVVIGKHNASFDISEFPFSYLTEEDGKSVLTPAMNLFTVGTKRDNIKWRDRDKRCDAVRYDLIHFDLFNPYIIAKVLQGITILHELYKNSSRDKEYVTYKGVHIKRLLLKRAIKYYEMAVKIYLGTELVSQLDAHSDHLTFHELKMKLTPQSSSLCEWYDMSGMFISSESKTKLMRTIRDKGIKDIDGLHRKLQQIYADFRKDSWKWCAALIETRFETPFSELEQEHFTAIIEDWRTNAIKLNNMILVDAGKEYDTSRAIGYGLDGTDSEKQSDFESVRGSLNSNSFVVSMRTESAAIQKKADHLINRFGGGSNQID